jgi:exodeoxyribonuclease-3
MGRTVDVYRLRHSEPGRFTWWDYRAGSSTRTSGCASTICSPRVRSRSASCTPTSTAKRGRASRRHPDHAPLVVDLDRPGKPFDAGWTGADERFAARRRGA